MTGPMDHCIDRFLSHLAVERDLSTNTLAAYGADLQEIKGFLKREGISTWEDLTRDHISAYLKKVGGKLSERSKARRMAALRSFCKYLLLVGALRQNPAVRVAFPKTRQSLPKVLSGGEVESLLKQPDGSQSLGKRDRAMLELFYATGLRVSELTELQLRQLHLEPGYLVVLGKGGKERLVPLGEWAAEALKRLPRGGKTPPGQRAHRAGDLCEPSRPQAVAPGGVENHQAPCPAGRDSTEYHSPHAPPFLCHPSAGTRS